MTVRVQFHYEGDARRPAGRKIGRIITEGDRAALIETDEIWDYDDDGLDEFGHPIMRPLYERYTVPVGDYQVLP